MHKDDAELVNIKELIQEAYKMDTNKTPLLGIAGQYIKYLMLYTWCNTVEDKLLLLKIIYKLIKMYPNRLPAITDHLVCNFSLIEDGTQEVYALYSTLTNLLHLRDKYENQPRWDKYYKKL